MPDTPTAPAAADDSIRDPESPDAPWRRGFWSLMAAQFQNALSDNILKNLVLFVVIAAAGSKREEELWSELVTGLFAAPFILFSLTGGYLADRFSKRTVTVSLKAVEVVIMLFTLIGLATNNFVMQLIAVFLMGTHSALFGPSKYGLIPELLPEKRISWGNGILQMTTNFAILGGLVVGAWLAEEFRGRQQWSGLLLIALAIVGLLASLAICRVPVADPTRRFRWNPFGDLWIQVNTMRKDRVLFLAVLGSTFFAFVGALALLNVVLYAKQILGLEGQETKIGMLTVSVALGIGLGSVAAGYLSGRKIEYGLVPLGSIGLTIFGMALGQSDLTYREVMIYLGLLGFSGGFYVVPISSLLQYRPSKEERGGVLAAVNLLSFVGVFLAAASHFALTRLLDLTPQGVFMASAVILFAGTVYAVWLMPDSLLRLVLWILTHTVYRIRVEGRDNIPEKGGALFVCNHVSFIDALLLIASTDRFLRCIMFKGIYDHPVVKPFAKAMRAIPISSQLRPREMIRSLREATGAIKAGEVVCIFAEGQITRIGQLLPFRRGFERIMKDVDAPIIPVAVDGVWGSIFSFERGRFLWKAPRYFPYPVTVCFGKPLPATATPFEVRQSVQNLIADAWPHRRKRMMTLDRTFLRKARHRPRRFFMADANTPGLTMGGALTRTVFLARRLGPVWRGQEMVGILLPPSVPAALVNYAALLAGKVPVNLNYTLSDEALASCARQCDLQTVITSKAFLKKVKLTVPSRAVCLEDVATKPGAGEKLAALALAWTCPFPLLKRSLGESTPAARRSGTKALDSLATVIFSSGSTGEPKGVMLTHYNIASNVEQLGQIFALGHKDRVLGILPFFHSFGFTGTLMLPATLAVGVVYHPNPLDAKSIGALVSRYGVTFLLATPTFLQMYTRGCDPEDFGSLQFVMAGAEKLPERVAQAFEDRFGIRPVEGYGCTECAPAVTVNTHDFRAAGFRQVGAKRGKIGHPLPGVAVKVVDPDTHQIVPVGQPGLLLVRGPNIMKGYLGKPEKSAEVLRDGWYMTGDIALLDEDGFVQITDRLTRFSKIGGEMVPHIKIEEKLHELAGVTEQTFAVAGVPDEKKGERLVVIHTLAEDKLKPVLEKFAACDLPNLWKPRADAFFQVEKLPYLGTGKLDLRKVKETAAQAAMAA